ncbi:MAG: hypothetical protein PHE20_03285 [Patescibacteria group bacterium]|nr:hypothetical protein [Patescibacteria group bacterium]
MAKILKTKIRKKDKYLEFIYWISQPSIMRQPKKLQDFAKKIGIHKDTLTNWKYTESFWEDVKTERISFMQEILGDAIVALKRRIIKYGRASDVRLAFQLAGEWNYEKKLSEEISIKVENKLTESKIEEMTDKLKKWKRENLE